MQSINKITLKALIIFALASSFYFYEFIMQVAPGVMAQTLMHDFAINATMLGVMSSCFYYSYTFMQLPGGVLIDRYGVRLILSLASATCVLGVLLFALAPNVQMASIARFVMGCGSAVAFISVLHLSVAWFPLKYFALFVGITEMMGSVGAIGGNIPLTVMFNNYGWRNTILIFAVIGLVLSLLILLIVRNGPAAHKDSDVKPIKNKPLVNIKIVFSNMQTWFIGIYSFVIWAPALAFSALWGVSFLKVSCQITNIQAAEAISFSWLGVALASPFLGWLSDKVGRRCLFMSVPALTGAIAITYAIFVPNISLHLLYFIMFLIGFASSGQTISFATIKDNNHYSVVGTANGLNNMIVVSGGILFQPLIGKFLDWNWTGLLVDGVRVYDLHSYRIAFLSLPICYLIAFLASAFFIKETHCQSITTTQ
jgi:MFS family permease